MVFLALVNFELNFGTHMKIIPVLVESDSAGDGFAVCTKIRKFKARSVGVRIMPWPALASESILLSSYSDVRNLTILQQDNID